MRKIAVALIMLMVLVGCVSPAFADANYYSPGLNNPGIKIINGWMAGPTGIDFAGFIGQSSGNVAVITGPNGVPTQDQMQIDSVAAIEAAYKINATGVESALGTFNNDTPVAYSSWMISKMAQEGFNPDVVGGPNIPPGSVTPAMMPNQYLLIDQINSSGWATQLNPSQTPAGITDPSANDVPTPLPLQSTGVNVVFTIGSTTFTVNDQIEVMDAAPFIDAAAGRTYVPVRYLAWALGATVNWNPQTQTVTLTKGSTTESMVIGSNTLTVNGQSQQMDVTPEIIPPGRTVLPARWVAQAFGYTVNWNASNQTVTIIE